MNSLDELILRWQEGNVSEEELRQLNALLARAENRQVLRDEFLLSAGLKAVCSLPPDKIIPIPTTSKWTPVAWVSAVAACVALSALLIRLLLPAPNAAFISGTGTKLHAGDIVRADDNEEQQIVLDSGKTSLKLRAGASLQIVSLDHPKKLRLEKGSITASVAPQRKPMLIDTRQAQAVVLGTEFVLSTLPHSTRLEVAHGNVQFTRASDRRTVNVHGNQFATVSPGLEFACLPLPPAPWRGKDIGAVAMHGSAFVDGGKCLVKGAGRNTCLQKDQLHFMYQSAGDSFDLRARLVSFSSGSKDARAGLMLRRSLNAACHQAFIGFRGDQKIEVQCRPDSDNHELFVSSAALPIWLRVTRDGSEVRFYCSKDNVDWQELASENIDLGEAPFAGLAVTSFNNEILDESAFEQVTLLAGNNITP